MMIDVSDDFGELYADIEVPTISAINGTSQFYQSYLNSPHESQVNRKHTDSSRIDSSYEQNLSKNDANLSDSGTGNVGDVAVENGNESESEDEDEDDDFVVVVNNDDFEAKASGVEGRRGDEEIELGITEGNFPGNGIVHSGNVSGGEYARRYGSTSMDAQKDASVRTVDREDMGYFQPRRSSCGRFEPTYAGSADHGNGFWLPRHRTIFDVDIDSLEQKPWTHSGVDMTDYFNFGFDEGTWKSYCQLVEQLRHPSFTQTRNQGYGNWRSNSAGATKELDYEEFSEHKSVASGQKTMLSHELHSSTRKFNRQIGQAIHVEDSNIERQPSMDVKPPRICDSDVIIEIAVQEQEVLSDFAKEPADKLEDKSEMSEKECEEGKLTRETHISIASKAYDPRIYSAEEEIVRRLTPSTDVRRSHESAIASSAILEKSCTQTEASNSASDTQNSGKVDTFSGGNHRAPNSLKDDASSDRDSTDTNPCVAGIDLLSDDHMQSNSILSFSLSEEVDNDDHRHLRRIQNSRRSSPDSVMDSGQVAKVDHHRSRVSKRDNAKSIGSCGKYPSRGRSPIEEGKKHNQRHLLTDSEMRIHNHNYNDHRFDIPRHMHTGSRSRHHRGIENWGPASDFTDEEWPSYRKNKYSLESYNRRSVENQFYLEDDRNLNAQREGDEDQFFYERTRRARGDMGRREWHLEEREYTFRKEKYLSKNPPHFMSEYVSSANMDRQIKYREYNDDYLDKRSKHVSPIEYNYDCLMTDEGAHSPLYGWQKDFMDSEIEPQRRLRYYRREARTSGRGGEFFEHPSSDIDYPGFIREDHEYQKGQAFPSIHNYCNEQPVYAEKRRYSSLRRDDADDNQICHRYEKSRRYISAKKSRDVRQPCDKIDAYDRDYTLAYLDQDDYFENRTRDFHYEGMDWQEDARPKSSFINAFYDEMLDSVKSIPGYECHGAKHGFVSDEMTLHTQGMKDKRGAINAGSKLFDRSSNVTCAKHERAGFWCRDSLEFHKFREKKVNMGKLWLRFYALVLVYMICLKTLGQIIILIACCVSLLKWVIPCIFLFRVPLNYKEVQFMNFTFASLGPLMVSHKTIRAPRFNLDVEAIHRVLVASGCPFQCWVCLLRDFSQSSGIKVSRPESVPSNDARLRVGKFQKHLKEQQVRDASFSDKTTVNKTRKFEGLRDRASTRTHCDLEEGQIPTEDPTKKFDSGCSTQKSSQKGQSTVGQKCVNQNGSCEYDESRILATMAKMEKRRERFKEPILVKKDEDFDSKPEVVKLVETTDSVGQRPKRKRQWGGS
ncbi:hypothetical protein KSS87_018178 [Heliosperma pusillum]|nr:hypothetical protein KSS87_018178 [Heliosperma pusillum]